MKPSPNYDREACEAHWRAAVRAAPALARTPLQRVTEWFFASFYSESAFREGWTAPELFGLCPLDADTGGSGLISLIGLGLYQPMIFGFSPTAAAVLAGRRIGQDRDIVLVKRGWLHIWDSPLWWLHPPHELMGLACAMDVHKQAVAQLHLIAWGDDKQAATLAARELRLRGDHVTLPANPALRYAN